MRALQNERAYLSLEKLRKVWTRTHVLARIVPGARFEPKSLTGKSNSRVSWSVRILLNKTKVTESCVVFEDVVLVAFCKQIRAGLLRE